MRLRMRIVLGTRMNSENANENEKRIENKNEIEDEIENENEIER